MASTQPNPEGSLAHPQAASVPTPSDSSPPQPTSGAASEVPQNLPLGLGQEQVIAILKHLPGVFSRVAQQGDLKDNAAAEALSNLSQSTFGHPMSQIPMHTFQVHPGLSEPGPSTHPNGPPNLGLSMSSGPNGSASTIRSGEGEDSTQPTDGQGLAGDSSTQSASGASPDDKPAKGSGGRRSGRSATMTNDEWARQRKDNHKEVERRRRGNINEGINELGRIVPNGSGEKAKGAILSRAVSYIHHLKENEARNIEKWTLEKLLMDQAMGDLQAQLEEMRRMWDEERTARQRAEAELAVIKGLQSPSAPAGAPSTSAPATTPTSAAPAPTSATLPATTSPTAAAPSAQDPPGTGKASPKRTLEEMNSESSPKKLPEEPTKRPRVE